MYFTIEAESTPPPVNAPNFTAFDGVWIAIAQDVQDYSYSSTITYESKTDSKYASNFEEGLKISAQVGFLDEKLSADASVQMQQTVSTTVTTIGTTSATATCGAVSCPDGRLYQWMVDGSTDNGETSTVSSCDYACVDNSIPSGPLCPFGFCGGDNAECQCCNAPWIEGNDDPDANHLCSSSNSTSA